MQLQNAVRLAAMQPRTSSEGNEVEWSGDEFDLSNLDMAPNGNFVQNIFRASA